MKTRDEVLQTEYCSEFYAKMLYDELPNVDYDAHEAAIDELIERAKNRLVVSFYKYGFLREAYPHKVDALSSMAVRLNRYQETGNTEYLIDAMNFAMIEYMLPRHPFLKLDLPALAYTFLVEYLQPTHQQAHFAATDAAGSPGRVTTQGVSQTANDAL